MVFLKTVEGNVTRRDTVIHAMRKTKTRQFNGKQVPNWFLIGTETGKLSVLRKNMVEDDFTSERSNKVAKGNITKKCGWPTTTKKSSCRKSNNTTHRCQKNKKMRILRKNKRFQKTHQNKNECCQCFLFHVWTNEEKVDDAFQLGDKGTTVGRALDQTGRKKSTCNLFIVRMPLFAMRRTHAGMPEKLIATVRKAVKNGTLTELGHPGETISGNHRRVVVDTLHKENKEDVRCNTFHAEVMCLDCTPEDAQRIFEHGTMRNVLDEIRVTTKLRSVTSSFRDQWLAQVANKKIKVNGRKFAEQRLASWKTATKKFTKKGEGFGKSLLEIVVDVSKRNEDNWQVFKKRWHPETDMRGKLKWPSPKDFGSFTCARDLPEEERAAKTSLHVSDPTNETFDEERQESAEGRKMHATLHHSFQQETMSAFFLVTGQRRIAHLFMEEHDRSNWEEFKKKHNFTSDGWLQTSAASLKQSEHPHGENCKTPKPVLAAHKHEKLDALAQSASHQSLKGTQVPCNEKKNVSLHAGGSLAVKLLPSCCCKKNAVGLMFLDLEIGRTKFEGEVIDNLFGMMHSTMRKENKRDCTVTMRHPQKDSGLMRDKCSTFSPEEIMHFCNVMSNKPSASKSSVLKNVVTMFTAMRKGNCKKTKAPGQHDENVARDAHSGADSVTSHPKLPRSLSAHVLTTILEWFHIGDERTLHLFPGVGHGLHSHLFKDCKVDCVFQHQESHDVSKNALLSKVKSKEIDQILPKVVQTKKGHHLHRAVLPHESKSDNEDNEENTEEDEKGQSEAENEDDDVQSAMSVEGLPTHLSPSQLERRKRMERRRTSDPTLKCSNDKQVSMPFHPTWLAGDAVNCANCGKVCHKACVMVVVSVKNGIVFCTKDCQAEAIGS
eukprot:jgi/Bigna1/79008/fgenesh1_pg.59_\